MPYYYWITDEMRAAGLYGPYLDLVGPWPTEDDRDEMARRAEEKARRILTESQTRLQCTFWVPGPGLCGWTGLASEAGWDPYFEEYVCPRCGASDGLRVIAQVLHP